MTEDYKNLVYKLLGTKFTYHDEKELYLHFDSKAYGEFVDFYNRHIEPMLVTDMAFCKDWGGKYHGEAAPSVRYHSLRQVCFEWC